MIGKPETIAAGGGVAQSERINPERKLISGQDEKALFFNCHMVVLAVKMILHFCRFYLRLIAL